jgi:hypothetical protein
MYRVNWSPGDEVSTGCDPDSVEKQGGR